MTSREPDRAGRPWQRKDGRYAVLAYMPDGSARMVYGKTEAEARAKQAGDSKRPACSWCHRPLPPRRRRFCCDDHRRRGQKAEQRYDEDQLAQRNTRFLTSTSKRAASGDLAALESLATITRLTDELTRMAVKKIRDRGDIPDEEIGRALGISRQAVGQRFGRKGVFTPEDTTALAGRNPLL